VSTGHPAAGCRCTGTVVIRLLRSPLTWVAVVALGVGAALGLYWFQPWKLVTDRTVAETLSSPAPAPIPAPTPAATATAEIGPTIVSAGDFVTHEHDTSGSARIVRAADGSHALEIVGLDTSNGPDLRVWLTDQPVRSGVAGWRVFDDGARVELGRLKGNKGDQVYALPSDLDPTAYRSVSIWCKRFSVSFGAAPLAAG
jgi:Electron transfer DM13